MRAIVWLFFLLVFAGSEAQDITNLYLNNKTPQWHEVIAYYQKLDGAYKEAKLLEAGITDCGKPLHLFVVSSDADFMPESIHQKGKLIFLINNGIHPGEPDGIDASMIFINAILKDIRNPKYRNIVFCIIPVYNIDGALNRGCCSRANQNGPEAYGFRGNYQNLDLNRDFIKCDTRNTESFIHLFQQWNPDVFLDTHVSNGADYPYNITLIATQKDKLTPSLGQYLSKNMLPDLYRQMAMHGEEMIPYVNTVEQTPESGLEGFLETPRFATGYSTLFNTLGFITETHMLKPYPVRVKATLTFMHVMTDYLADHLKDIKNIRAQAIADVKTSIQFPIQWQLDRKSADSLLFKGYKASYKPSTITGLPRLYYDRNKPYQLYVPYYNFYKPSVTVNKPLAYIIPQCWKRVIERLQMNDVIMQPLNADTSINVECYEILNYKATSTPYEGHYLHSSVEVKTQLRKVNFYAGDWLIYTNQAANRYIIETLEPQATDAFFAWGFFDGVLQQKEWFSDYVFEDIAEHMVAENPDLLFKIKDAIAKDSTLKDDQYRQLYVIYKNSPYMENSFKIYPVYRLLR
jgi:hypothetical protein